MVDETPTPAGPVIKKSPDGNMVAIATEFSDDPDAIVQSFIYVTARGMSGYKTAAQVAEWTDV